MKNCHVSSSIGIRASSAFPWSWHWSHRWTVNGFHMILTQNFFLIQTPHKRVDSYRIPAIWEAIIQQGTRSTFGYFCSIHLRKLLHYIMQTWVVGSILDLRWCLVHCTISWSTTGTKILTFTAWAQSSSRKFLTGFIWSTITSAAKEQNYSQSMYTFDSPRHLTSVWPIWFRKK